jgi:hypothetical protein
LQRGDTRKPLKTQVSEVHDQELSPLVAVTPVAGYFISMVVDSTGKSLADGDACVVVAGTHKGKSGIVQDSNISKTGAATITVKQSNGERFKTLARNVRVTK